MLFEAVHAMDAAGSTPAGGDISPLISLAPFLLIFLIFYFLLIRPSQKERRKQQELLDNLKSGDRVVTTGGILGTVHSITDNIVQLKIGDKIRISVLRNAVRGLQAADKGSVE